MKRLTCIFLAMLLIISAINVVFAQDGGGLIDSSEREETPESDKPAYKEAKTAVEGTIPRPPEQVILPEKKGFIGNIIEKIKNFFAGLFGVEAEPEEVPKEVLIKEVETKFSFTITATIQKRIENIIATADKLEDDALKQNIIDTLSNPDITNKIELGRVLDKIEQGEAISTPIQREGVVRNTKTEIVGEITDVISKEVIRTGAEPSTIQVLNPGMIVPVTLIVTRDTPTGPEPAANELVIFQDQSLFIFNPIETMTGPGGEATTQVIPKETAEGFDIGKIYAVIQGEGGTTSSQATVIVAEPDLTASIEGILTDIAKEVKI